MSPDPADKAAPASGNGNSLDASLNRAIEAMNFLRDDLRREGITPLADHLDDVVVKCLALYLERENGKTVLARPPISDGTAST
ncbi:MAG: hypothetical protein QM647_18455 [Asticcacaulis sp.]|uniref:hypothetical protein n=1 Tax=Asticcacaulis sp. TaxID=1872648 RepID=UPI0039E5B720